MINYSLIQKYLHHFILGNNFVKKSLFDIEKMIFLEKDNEHKLQKHIFITGLPRSGTTILLEFIYKTQDFASLTYSDMPFIMAVNLYGKIFRNKNIPLTERIHQNGIKFDLKSPEAFDEVFFKTYKKNSYEDNFSNFVSLVLKKYNKKRYLSKNNNNYKRINLINSNFSNAIILITYRNPLQHCNSLLIQHKHMCELQKKEKFILNYMNYLGHYEFGLNYKNWNLSEKYKDPFSLNHWLEQWYFFYNQIIKISEKNHNILLVPYDEICNQPSLAKKLVQKIDINHEPDGNFFKISKKEIKDSYENDILLKCLDIFEKMKNLNISLNNL